MPIQIIELAENDVVEVIDVQDIAYLQSVAAETHVRQLPAEQVTRQPQHDKPLVDLSHLPGPGQHPAAVDDRAEAVHRMVLLDEEFGRELGGAVERAGAGERKLLGNAGGADAGLRKAVAQDETLRTRFEQQRPQRLDRIDAAAREEDESRAMPARMFQAIRRPEQIGMDQIVRVAAITGMHARFGGGLDENADRPYGCKIVGRTNVAMHELDSSGAQARQGELAAAPLEVIEGDDGRRRAIALESNREVGADETRAASHKDTFDGHFSE